MLAQLKLNEIIQPTVEILENYSKYNETMEPLKADIIETPLTPVLAISDEDHLLLVDFVDAHKTEANIKRLVEGFSRGIVKGNTKPLDMFRRELNQYFQGQLMEFHTPIKLNRNATEFREAVWHQIHAIPFGKTKSYAELATAIGKPNGYRAVANACGMNPLTLIVPCHRVTGSNGGLGGFSCGIDKKKWLLQHEKKLYEY